MLLNAAQYFGARGTLVVPATLGQLRAWTDAGIPVVIAWNPEGRPWSHASVVVDVTDTHVQIMDPNIPDPDATFRFITHDDFYRKWGEEASQMIIRRPACAIEREVTMSGKQITPRTASVKVAYGVSVKKLRDGSVVVNAGPSYQTSARRLIERAGFDFRLIDDQYGSWIFPEGLATADELMKALVGMEPVRKAQTAGRTVRDTSSTRASVDRVASTFIQARAKRKNKPKSQKTKMKVDKTAPKPRNEVQRAVQEQGGMGGSGSHQNRSQDVEKGHSRKTKHKKPLAATAIDRISQGYLRMALDAACSGNPDGKPIYDVDVDHGEHQPLSGDHDIMKRLQDRHIKKQGSPQREKNPRLARSGANLDRKTRSRANRALVKAKLDGNGRFRKPEHAYSQALNVLATFGIELDEVVSSHLFQARPGGSVIVHLAFSNLEDSFSPTSVGNSTLFFQFTELREDMFEAVAYLS